MFCACGHVPDAKCCLCSCPTLTVSDRQWSDGLFRHVGLGEFRWQVRTGRRYGPASGERFGRWPAPCAHQTRGALRPHSSLRLRQSPAPSLDMRGLLTIVWCTLPPESALSMSILGALRFLRPSACGGGRHCQAPGWARQCLCSDLCSGPLVQVFRLRVLILVRRSAAPLTPLPLPASCHRCQSRPDQIPIPQRRHRLHPPLRRCCRRRIRWWSDAGAADAALARERAALASSESAAAAAIILAAVILAVLLKGDVAEAAAAEAAEEAAPVLVDERART